MLGRGVGTRGGPRNTARNRDDVDDMRGASPLERGKERSQAPDGPEVVDADDVLDPLRGELDEPSSSGDAGVVDEQADCGVASRDCGRHRGDGVPIGDVADLEVASELGGQRLDPLAPARDEDAAPPARGERPRSGRSDAARASRDDGYSLNVRSVSRLMATVSSIGSA